MRHRPLLTRPLGGGARLRPACRVGDPHAPVDPFQRAHLRTVRGDHP